MHCCLLELTRTTYTTLTTLLAVVNSSQPRSVRPSVSPTWAMQRLGQATRAVRTADPSAHGRRSAAIGGLRYFRNLSNIDDRVRNTSWQTLNLTQTLTLTLILTLTPTLTIYILIHIHGHLGLTGCRNSVWSAGAYRLAAWWLVLYSKRQIYID